VKVIRVLLVLFILACQYKPPSFTVHASISSTTSTWIGKSGKPIAITTIHPCAVAAVAAQPHMSRSPERPYRCKRATRYSSNQERMPGASPSTPAGQPSHRSPSRQTAQSVIINGSGGSRDAFFITEAHYVCGEGLRIQMLHAQGCASLCRIMSPSGKDFANNGTWAYSRLQRLHDRREQRNVWFGG